MRNKRAWLGLVVASVGASCGGGAGSGQPAAPSLTPQVSGQYSVAVTLGQNSCGPGVTVAPQPTSVAQSAGASGFTLVHGVLSLTGTVSRDGSFSTQPLALRDPQGPAQLAIAGRFTTTGLAATATVDIQRPAAAGGDCRYLVDWTGSKQGPPNVLG